MRLEVLHVPDCPNLPLLLERLAQVTDLPVMTRVIDSDDEAARFGMAGSPTLLVDGIDPFAASGDYSLSCRLYRDHDGRVVSVPSIEQLRSAINGRSTRPPGSSATCLPPTCPACSSADLPDSAILLSNADRQAITIVELGAFVCGSRSRPRHCDGLGVRRLGEDPESSLRPVHPS
ncbi:MULTISPECIES: hypothetical protein [unclassified Kribbella]|uniref:hypothetical protein n=1 Tax=unclassified Kribbella TaxID=2644121 RepID=UPI0030168F02